MNKKSTAPPEPETYPDLVSACIEARKRGDDSKWFLGDAALTVETKYAEHTLENFARDIDVEFASLQDYRRVSAAFELSVRNDNLSWSHHRALAGIEDVDERLKALAYAAAPRVRGSDEPGPPLSVAETIQCFRPAKEPGVKREPPPEKYVTCPQCDYVFSLTPDTSELDEEIESLHAAIDNATELDQFEPWLDRTELRYSRAVIQRWRRGEPNSKLYPSPDGELDYTDILDSQASELGFENACMLLAAVDERRKLKDRLTAARSERVALRANGVTSSAPVVDEAADALARLAAQGKDNQPPVEPLQQIVAAERKSRLRGFARRSHRRTADEPVTA